MMNVSETSTLWSKQIILGQYGCFLFLPVSLFFSFLSLRASGRTGPTTDAQLHPQLCDGPQQTLLFISLIGHIWHHYFHLGVVQPGEGEWGWGGVRWGTMFWWTGLGQGWSGLLGAWCWMRGFSLKQHGSVCVRRPGPPPAECFLPSVPSRSSKHTGLERNCSVQRYFFSQRFILLGWDTLSDGGELQVAQLVKYDYLALTIQGSRVRLLWSQMHRKDSQKQLNIFSGCTKRLKLLQFFFFNSWDDHNFLLFTCRVWFKWRKAFFKKKKKQLYDCVHQIER